MPQTLGLKSLSPTARPLLSAAPGGVRSTTTATKRRSREAFRHAASSPGAGYDEGIRLRAGAPIDMHRRDIGDRTIRRGRQRRLARERLPAGADRDSAGHYPTWAAEMLASS
jgi:hypothetical protein